MINYNTGNVVQYTRQYEMFANSLNLVKTINERSMIIEQLTKLIKKIIELNEETYEKEYYKLVNKASYLLDDEKTRIVSLMDIINQRLTYIEKINNNHYRLTGVSIDIPNIPGSDSLESLEERLKVIEKYQQNIELQEKLNTEIAGLENKIEFAKEKVDINVTLNRELEKKMKNLLTHTFDKLNINTLIENKDEIEAAYYEVEKCLNLAKQNFEKARTLPGNMATECQEMITDIEKDYIKYKEKICLIKLMEIFERDVEDYDELLIKRKEINELMKNIKDNDVNNMIYNEVSKQYETIIKEMNDINTYNNLVSERDSREKVLLEIEEENNSEKFQEILGELLENEEKRKQALIEEQKRIEEEERKRKLEIERKKQEELLKRQKLLEEARKKEVERRTKEMLVEQQNSFLQNKKNDKFNFESIKNSYKQEEPIVEEEPVVEEQVEDAEEVIEETPIYKNKVDIEKELFDEFNTNSEVKEHHDESKETSELDELIEESKLPNMSIDEYMDKFDESKVHDTVQDLFNDDEFPSIPM